MELEMIPARHRIPRISARTARFFFEQFYLEERPVIITMHEHPVFARCPEVYYSPLRDGDVVFFPASWYHYFHNIEGSISVTTQSCPLA